MTTPLRVLVLTAFGPDAEFGGGNELDAWLDGYGEFVDEIAIPGAPTPLYVTDHGVGVTATEMGPVRAAATTTAWLSSDAVDTTDAYVVTAGIAGISPHVGTVGSVVLADHVVDWDTKLRDSDGVEPWGFGPQTAFELDADLVAAAYDVASTVELADSTAARALRARYQTSPATEPPQIAVGTTASGSDFWHGERLAAQVESLVETYDAGTYATTECEGFATAVVCDRFDKLDRYLSVRAASNFDRPPRDAEASTDLEIAETAFDNAYRVGRAIADTIANDWEHWRDGPPVTREGP